MQVMRIFRIHRSGSTGTLTICGTEEDPPKPTKAVFHMDDGVVHDEAIQWFAVTSETEASRTKTVHTDASQVMAYNELPAPPPGCRVVQTSVNMSVTPQAVSGASRPLEQGGG